MECFPFSSIFGLGCVRLTSGRLSKIGVERSVETGLVGNIGETD